jgi:transglutaminase-like putative cysteine protease
VSGVQHCRAEAYLDNAGWLPLDPADVRKVILEQKLALGSPDVQALRVHGERPAELPRPVPFRLRDHGARNRGIGASG